ncbi:dipeptide ABC transporter permease and ATP-binding protein [Modestobacter italicus]|uniref:Dipeptide ABC transporter permease and ATP-binding protein n=1 Tax=Modestobacter italicus (strain DSM 44449 / CECT 9708 / BC 501) TaxID=2732864 RepID=I4EXS9_MODI5|nr:dipeptide/oligopeptide/nickel ABC transporter permease/ATP-binding protein [Modestobacter marinus]CCH88192.1 dipeptide ABC transporter permease and ATP-binding protein [Modestobacter marinus]
MSILSDSDPTAGAAGAAPVDVVASRPRPGVVRRLLRSPIAVVSLGWLALVAVLAAAAPLLTSASPTASKITEALAPMGGAHLLGTDGVGRDVLAQLLYGARVSLIGALIVVVVSLLVGLPAGILAGYHRGRFDAAASWSANLVMAQPAIIVLLVVLASFGRSTALAMLVFGLLIGPGVFRLVRASVIGVREELYVDAARVSGLGEGRIMRRHILPVVVAPTVIQMSQILGIAIVVQAGLEFIGLGSANQASWGGMLSDAFQNIYAQPRLVLWPGLAIVLTVTACSLLGNALRDSLGISGRTPRVRRRATATALGTAGVAAVEEGAGDGAGPADPDALLVLDGLRVAYPQADGTETEVVRGVSLTVHRGEVLGLVGESGSGKTQTAFAVLGLLPAQARTSARRMTFDGSDLWGLSPAAMNRLRGRRIGYIPQEPMSNLDPAFRIGSQLTEPMRHHLGMSRAQARTEALRLLARVGIADPQRVFDSYPHQISGGMAQRVLIAGAVSCDPDLLIADEPTTALDVTVQAEVLDLIRELQAERRMGVVLVTHNFGVVADLCDTVAVMQSGRVVETAPAERLFDAPEHPYTRMLLASSLEDTAPRPPLTAPDARATEPQPLPVAGGPR